MKQIKIQSNGTGRGTYIYDENGEKLTTVLAVTLHMDPESVTADLVVGLPMVDVVADVAAVAHACPVCGSTQ